MPGELLAVDEQRDVAMMEDRPIARGAGIAAMLRSILGRESRVPGGLRWRELEHLLNQCARGVGGEAAVRSRIGKVLRYYREADDEEKRRFLALLNDNFGTDQAKVRTAIDAYLKADEPMVHETALDALRGHLDAPRLKLLGQFNLAPDGVFVLVQLRADLQRFKDEKTRFAALERDLDRLFGAWFDIGFLELKRIGWNSSAALLEKLIRYEAVHEITSWSDLRNRLDSDRRCYAFFHPRMPDEPLIFIEVALMQEIAADVHAILDEAQPTLDPGAANVAVFYSISNTQPGLKGISFGEFLIKRVVEQLQLEFPGLKTFATLSPVPTFIDWLMRQDVSAQERSLPRELEFIWRDSADAREAQLQSAITGEKGQHAQQLLEVWLRRQCAHYLLAVRRGPEPLDPVGRFHFSNGARLERINWLADTSMRGLRQSGGLMVNYLYSLKEIENNHDAYFCKGTLAASRQVRRLLDC